MGGRSRLRSESYSRLHGSPGLLFHAGGQILLWAVLQSRPDLGHGQTQRAQPACSSTQASKRYRVHKLRMLLSLKPLPRPDAWSGCSLRASQWVYPVHMQMRPPSPRPATVFFLLFLQSLSLSIFFFFKMVLKDKEDKTGRDSEQQTFWSSISVSYRMVTAFALCLCGPRAISLCYQKPCVPHSQRLFTPCLEGQHVLDSTHVYRERTVPT